MRVHLKGIHILRMKLASGATAHYHYAWRGGPRLVGEPGSPEFIASYYAAIHRGANRTAHRFFPLSPVTKPAKIFLALARAAGLII